MYFNTYILYLLYIYIIPVEWLNLPDYITILPHIIIILLSSSIFTLLNKIYTYIYEYVYECIYMYIFLYLSYTMHMYTHTYFLLWHRSLESYYFPVLYSFNHTLIYSSSTSTIIMFPSLCGQWFLCSHVWSHEILFFIPSSVNLLLGIFLNETGSVGQRDI